MADRTFTVGQRVFLTSDARVWMQDVGVRPGTVVLIDKWPVVEWWEIDGRSYVAPWNLEETVDADPC